MPVFNNNTGGLRHCPRCGADYTGETCPHCKQKQTVAPGLMYLLAGFGGGALLLFGLGAMASGLTGPHREEIRPEPTVRPTQTTEAADTGIYPSGDYAVGEDIPAGNYVIVSEGHGYGDFYTGVYPTSDMEDGTEIWWGWAKGNRYVILENGQYLHFSYSTLRDPALAPVDLDPFTRCGMFLVGQDIEAGNYTLVSSDSQYSGSFSVYTTITADGPVEEYSGYIETGGSAVVTLRDGQYLQTDFCIVKPRS